MMETKERWMINVSQFNPTVLSLKDTIYQRIVERISLGELAPGTTFSEQQLIRLFAVSKSPVREALIQLCSENVLRSIPRQGYQVVEINSKDIQDLTQLRLLLELGNLPYAIEHLTSERIAELYRQNAERRLADNKQLWESRNRNTRFHMTLIRYGENAQIAKCMEHAMATCTRAYAQLFTAKKHIIAPSDDNQHDLIVRALEQHDIYTAHECLKQDILLMAKTLGVEV